MAKTGLTTEQFRVRPGARLRLADHPTDWLPPAARAASKEERKERAADELSDARTEIDELQQRLYADNCRALLLVFQAMDAGGKDSTIRHVLSGVNPQGCQVTSFKVPSTEELEHDFLWRYSRALPEKGRIGVFNRSHYEEVLVVRVHPELLIRQRIPDAKPTRAFWRRRYEHIVNWEARLEESGIHVVKFFLNVSLEEQAKRFLERIDDPSKNWKFSAADLVERKSWDAYQAAFAEALPATSTERSPWYVIPADRKYVMRGLVGRIVADELRDLGARWPVLTPGQHADLESARAELVAEVDAPSANGPAIPG